MRTFRCAHGGVVWTVDGVVMSPCANCRSCIHHDNDEKGRRCFCPEAQMRLIKT